MEEEKKQESFFKETIRFAIITLIIVLPIRLFIAEPFIVSGASMEPTFSNGEYLIVDRISYRLENPKRGEVIIFRYPKDPSKYFIKRVIGLPGESISMSSGVVIIKNKDHPEGFEPDQSYIINKENYSNFSTVLSQDQYFVLGDNRSQSSDSRAWGNLDKNYIVGRTFLRLFPPTRLNIFPGNQETN